MATSQDYINKFLATIPPEGGNNLSYAQIYGVQPYGSVASASPAPRQPSVTKPGYWTEGTVVNGTNVGGGRYVEGTAPVSTPLPIQGATAVPTTMPNTVIPSTTPRSPTAYESSLKSAADAAASRASLQAEADQYAANQRQARIDAINTTFAPRIAAENKAGAARMSRVDALNFKSGITGSGVDTTKLGAQESLNKEALQSIEDSKATAINEAFGWADQLARQRTEDAYSAATKSAEANVAYQKELLDTANKTIENMGKGGVSLDSLKSSEPNTYKNIVDTTGLSDLQLASILNTNSPQPSNVSTTIENGYLISSYFDPITKKQKVVTEKLPEGATKEDLQISQGDNGYIYVINKNTGQVVNSVNATKDPSTGPVTGEVLKQFINKQLATPEMQKATPEERALYIQSQGGTPYDFGY